MGLVWYFSTSPAIQIINNDEAMITIAFAHAGELREPCRKLSAEELAQLAPNMRKLEDCPRERSPVTIEAYLDGELFYHKIHQPPGLFGDGGVDIYYSKKITSGRHRLVVLMNDSVLVKGFNHNFDGEVKIDPAHVLLVDFDSRYGFIVK